MIRVLFPMFHWKVSSHSFVLWKCESTALPQLPYTWKFTINDFSCSAVTGLEYICETECESM